MLGASCGYYEFMVYSADPNWYVVVVGNEGLEEWRTKNWIVESPFFILTLHFDKYFLFCNFNSNYYFNLSHFFKWRAHFFNFDMPFFELSSRILSNTWLRPFVCSFAEPQKKIICSNNIGLHHWLSMIYSWGRLHLESRESPRYFNILKLAGNFGKLGKCWKKLVNFSKFRK